MSVLPELFREIDSCKYLFLREISEPQENRIRLLVEEAGAIGEKVSLNLPGTVITDWRPIEATADSRLFELVWNFYVAYSVRNESFVARDGSETFSGRLFNVYSRSHFLDYVSTATFARKEHPGPLHHFGVNCLNHIIDVISTEPPKIRQLRP